jgi:hypothetical protein
MNTIPLLITFYNTLPSNPTDFFTISNGNLRISKIDSMSTITASFFNQINNNIVYIFNDVNLGSITIDSLISSDEISFTYKIILKSIPPNLKDNVVCVLSSTLPNYNITRIYLQDNTIQGTFYSPDNQTFTINRNSLPNKLNPNMINTESGTTSNSYNNSNNHSSDDTLLLYIISTSKSFTIVFNTQTIYTISNIKLLSPNLNNPYLIFSVTFPQINFVNNAKYNILLSVDNSSTISNIVFNNTIIVPIDDKAINLVHENNTIQNDITITPVLLNNTNTVEKNSLNDNQQNTQIDNQCAILNIQNPSLHNIPGYFSLSLPESSEHFSNYFTPDMSKNIIASTSKLTNNTTLMTNNLLNTTSNLIANAYKNTSHTVKKLKMNYSPPTQPDIINNIPIVSGLSCNLNISLTDINNNPINFITNNKLIYLSNCHDTYIYNIYNTNTIKSILSSSGILNNKILPDFTQNIPYVLSTGPISPFHKFNYISDLTQNAPIINGAFTELSRNILVISNSDIFNANTTPFLSLLYTIINTNITLNILNPDYSYECNLLVTNVAITQSQARISYSIKSGSIPKNTTTNYIFSILGTSDVISSVNATNTYYKLLNDNNNLLLGLQNTITTIQQKNQNDPNINQALSLIQVATNQSTILLATPIILNRITSLQIVNATIVLGFNAINYSMINNPTNHELQFFYNKINSLACPIIINYMLKNALSHINSALVLNKNPAYITIYTLAQKSINDALTHLSFPSAIDISTLNNPSTIPSVSKIIIIINNALNLNPGDINLLKAQAILKVIQSISNNTYQVESMTNQVESMTNQVESKTNQVGIITNQIEHMTNLKSTLSDSFFNLIKMIIIVSIIIYLLNYYLNNK